MPVFKVSKKAGLDLVEIGQYTQNKFGIAQRNTYLDSINAKFHTLTKNPQSGIVCEYIRKGYLLAYIGSHSIFYKEYSYGIRIIRVLHQRMDWHKHL
jgi:toxin ParE1/3/4